MRSKTPLPPPASRGTCVGFSPGPRTGATGSTRANRSCSLGGSDQDNLFNHPNLGPNGLEAHLDLLVSVGGNYVRNTMSSRDRADEGSDFFNDDNLYAFHRDEQSGLYDLDRFNDAYWARFRDFLEMTAERDIIVQIEIWDRWDYSGDREPHYRAYGWSAHPFNPKNNINYTSEQTGLSEERWQGHPIFRTTTRVGQRPAGAGLPGGIRRQAAFDLAGVRARAVLHQQREHASEPWSRHWARFVRDRARGGGRGRRGHGDVEPLGSEPSHAPPDLRSPRPLLLRRYLAEQPPDGPDPLGQHAGGPAAGRRSAAADEQREDLRRRAPRRRAGRGDAQALAEHPGRLRLRPVPPSRPAARLLRRRPERTGPDAHPQPADAHRRDERLRLRAATTTCSATGSRTRPTAWPSRAGSTRSISPTAAR
jgi:hypothetical protein